MKPSKKWREMSLIYARFAKDWPLADFSEDAAAALFLAETHGTKLPETKTPNGFALGKKWMDVTLKMWREDIPARLLTAQELRDDGFPEWFLKRTGILSLRPNATLEGRAVRSESGEAYAGGGVRVL